MNVDSTPRAGTVGRVAAANPTGRLDLDVANGRCTPLRRHRGVSGAPSPSSAACCSSPS
jgi:hypothetical protein